MTLKIYNTLSQQKEEFFPVHPPQVNMYVCGITPYDETHLGHARAYVSFDIIRRYLEYVGYKVRYVQNITDIDDKIIAKSQSTQTTFQEVAAKYSASYFTVMDKLNVKRADSYPKATEHIPDMLAWIKQLLDEGYAYVLEGDVYFEIARFASYGKLSKRKLEDMEAGARVEVDARKKSPHDFALWKKAKEGEPSWESPWGPGRPGWHIECSVMSVKYLGQPFDIHGGGRDLIFPHHENEIAQAEAATGRLFARYWVHNGFVNVNKQKMSKSLGNFFTLQDIFKQYAPMVVRLFLLSTHYRSPINYSDQELTAAREAYERIVKFIANLDFLLSQTQEHAPEVEERDLEEELLPYKQEFTAAMEDDFNTAGALAALFSLLHFCNKVLAEGEAEKECLESMKKNVLALCDVLGIVVASSSSALSTESDEEEIKRLVVEREDARKKKDFASADKIRHQLSSLGILLEDTPYGTKWTKK